MKDLGLNPHRKSNFLAEMFVRYRPSDYRGILDEYLALKGRESKEFANGHKLGIAYATGNDHALPETHELKGERKANGLMNGVKPETLHGNGNSHALPNGREVKAG